MASIFLELEKLRSILMAKGYSGDQLETLINKAEQEINQRLREKLDAALENAVQSGIQKDSTDFINEVRPRPDAFMLETESGNTDFSEPPMPTLDRLLSRGAKPIKDGSGIYKVIPVGGQSTAKKSQIHSNIFDAQKAVMAERYENAAAQYNKIAPKSSAVKFRTATSKQNKQTQWVQPAKEKDFTDELAQLNMMLQEEHDSIILEVIRSYEDNF